MFTGQLPSLLVPDCVTVAERASTDRSQNFTDPCFNILQAVACTQWWELLLVSLGGVGVLVCTVFNL